MIYLASLYSLDHHTDSKFDRAVRHQRAIYAMKRQAEFQSQGLFVFSPIAHCHTTSQLFNRPAEYKFYKDFDRHMVAKSDELWVLMMGDWERSVGIQDEIAYAKIQRKPIVYVDCPDFVEYGKSKEA